MIWGHMVANWSTADVRRGADFSVDRRDPKPAIPTGSTLCAFRRGSGNATVTGAAGAPGLAVRRRQLGLDEQTLRGDLAHKMLGPGAFHFKQLARLDEDTPWRVRRGAGAQLRFHFVGWRSALSALGFRSRRPRHRGRPGQRLLRLRQRNLRQEPADPARPVALRQFRRAAGAVGRPPAYL